MTLPIVTPSSVGQSDSDLALRSRRGVRNCPEGHALTRELVTPHILFVDEDGGDTTCDLCGSAVPVGDHVWQCRPCNFDVCCMCAACKSPRRAEGVNFAIRNSLARRSGPGCFSLVGGFDLGSLRCDWVCFNLFLCVISFPHLDRFLFELGCCLLPSPSLRRAAQSRVFASCFSSVCRLQSARMSCKAATRSTTPIRPGAIGGERLIVVA